ncbi:MAG: DUF6159 family protein [Acidimicrobiia bacterium]|jgi:hypothetical protein
MFERMRRGWDLTKKAWGVVRSNPGLARLPIYGGVLALLSMLVLAAPGAVLLSVEDAGQGVKVGGALLVLLGIYLASFSVIYFNVALAAAADEALAGREPDLAAARGVARGRLGLVAGWAVVSVAVSLILGAVRDRGGSAGRAVAGIGGAIWSLVTFLVVPVLAFEGIGPVAAMKRSASLFRERWGQQVTGNVVIGGASGLVAFLGILLGIAGLALLVSGGTAGAFGGGFLLAAGVVVTVAAAAFSGAMRGVFGVALYHYVTEDAALGPFTTADLESVARTR